MGELLRKARHGQMGVYVQFLFILVIATAVILYVLAISGCGSCDDGDVEQYTDTPPVVSYQYVGATSCQAKITSISEIHSPGYMVSRTLGAKSVEAPFPDGLTFKYYPPDGYTNFQPVTWAGGVAPDNPQGPLPYVWQNRPIDWKNTIQWRVPSMPSGQDQMVLVETLEAWESDTIHSTAQVEITINRVSSSELGDTFESSIRTTRYTLPAGQADANAWQVSPWYSVSGVTMTTSLCQEWLNFMQGDNAFAAVRVPMVTAGPDQSYDNPVMFSSACSPTMTLSNWDMYPAVTTGLETRPGRSTFLANNLPSADGEQWVGMGVGSTPGVTCPDLLNMPAGQWLLNVNGCLNLPPDPTLLPIFFCYEGEDQPMLPPAQMAALKTASSLGVDLLGEGVSVTSYPEEGVTCVGPLVFHLQLEGDLALWGSHSTVISPTQAISFPHAVSVSHPMTVSLSTSSSLGPDWKIYGDDLGHPDLSDPITGPIWVKYYKNFWLTNVVPAGASGSHNLLMTGTAVLSPSTFDVTSDLFYAGDWVEPPPPPPGPQPYMDLTYLPVLFKDSVQPVTAPDLVITCLRADQDQLRLVIYNQGSEAVSEKDSFWVDVYIDPDPVPTGVNQEWYRLSEQGMVWGVSGADVLPMQPGQAITLTVGDELDSSKAEQHGLAAGARHHGLCPGRLGQPGHRLRRGAGNARDHGLALQQHSFHGQRRQLRGSGPGQGQPGIGTAFRGPAQPVGVAAECAARPDRRDRC